MSDKAHSDDEEKSSEQVQEKKVDDSDSSPVLTIDLYSYHETNAGRLVIDPGYVTSPLVKRF